MTIKLNYFFANIFFLCALFPFVSPIPLHWLIAGTGSDTQPIILLPAIILGLSYLHSKNAKVSLIEILFFIVATYSLFYTSDDPNSFILKKRVGLLFSFILFIAARRYYHLFSFDVFKYAVTINFLLYAGAREPSALAYSIELIFINLTLSDQDPNTFLVSRKVVS